MRESRIYLNFFRRNLIIIFTPAVLGFVIAYLYISQLPNVNVVTRLYEMSYEKNNISDSIALTDEAITEIRSGNIQKSIGIDPKTQMIIYKPGPLSINLSIQSENLNLGPDLQKADNYLSNKFSVKKIGMDIKTIKEPNYFIYFLTGSLGGFLAGILTSLLREYFKNY